MAKSEQDTYIDEWAAEQNRHIGEITIPPLGEYPPDFKCWYGSLMNEYVTTDLIRHFADASGDRNPLWRTRIMPPKQGGGVSSPRLLLPMG